ncbi:ketoacyl-synt-domain-containing protein [Aspergillus ellipticus CBS 707.79]|uniref:Ketoacyl-synt-domain-containing protein n=1 Tax=Aspergillus ellipticus CBS 707.79 TaxID=1448320 RepID=A0A319DZD7_9EURO|nr:ketoacyl-synt-domain-containing protein [Aspergillus ellipticus CBS 707.79]
MSAVESNEDTTTLEPIAIVGMACRLPGSTNSPSKLWELLCKKQSIQTPRVPLNHLEDFDPSLSPVEAMWLDPQQRKMLEVSYECLENAGLKLEDISGTNTAVFIGCFTSDYQQMSTAELDFRHNYCATGVDVGIISNRIGNTFNLRGPSFTINTACSSSVYAIHNACHALRAYDCMAAIAGGVNLILTVDQHMNTAKLGILSETSTCHTFDASADGYGRAEGAGALYLKRVSDAIKDGDVIRGIIRSSAVNSNGKVDGMGITYPSVDGQERAIRTAYMKANLDPNQTAYFECHGTGTPVGDPIEVRAVSNAMNETRSRDNPILLGAIKPNIGHSGAASGIFAVMKAAMATESGLIPAVYGFKTLNPNIKDKDWNIEIATDLIEWPKDFNVRRVSVSSFGYGGTNGHIIIENVNSIWPWYEHGQPRAIASYHAHDVTTLRQNIEAHRKIANNYHIPDLAYTLNSTRSRFDQRAYTAITEGAQWPRMGYEAMQTFPVFRRTIEALDEVLHSGAIIPKPSWTLMAILEASEESSHVGEAEISQPACTAIQIAIVDLFATWGIEPVVTIGHSSGEIGAAYAAGPGSMLAVGVSASEANRYIPEHISEVVIASTGIAEVKAEFEEAGVFNCELRTGKAYHSAQMDIVAPEYEKLFVRAMESLNGAYLDWRRPKAAMISTVTGSEYDDEISISYFCTDLRCRVLFDSAVTTLGSSASFSSVNQLVEIGPHSALGGPTKQICATRGFNHLGYIYSLRRGTDSAIALLKTAGEFFNRGTCDINFDMINQVEDPSKSHGARQRVAPRYIPNLPPYQWNYKHTFWYEPRPSQERRHYKFEWHDILGRRIFGLSENAPAWQNTLRQRDVPWLKDHTLGDAVVFPAAGHLTLAVEAYVQLLDLNRQDIAGVVIRDLKISKALTIPDTDDGVEIQTRLSRVFESHGNEVVYSFAVESIVDRTWVIHSEGKICGITQKTSEQLLAYPLETPVGVDQLAKRTSAKRWYDSFHRVGFRYGPSFQTIRAVHANGKDRMVAANVKIQKNCGLMTKESRYMLHPSTIDGCLHLVIASNYRGKHKHMKWGVVPLQIERISLFFPGPDDTLEGRAHAHLWGESGRLLMDMKNLKTVRYDASVFAQVSWKPYVTDTVRRENCLLSNAVPSFGHVAIGLYQVADINMIELQNIVNILLTFRIDDGTISHVTDNADSIIIDDRTGTLLSQISKQAFDNKKSILCLGKSILWLTRGVNAGNSSRITLLDVDEEVKTSEICPVILARLAGNVNKDSGEDVEFWLQADGSLWVPRIAPNDRLNELFFRVIFYISESQKLLGAHEAEIQVQLSELAAEDLKPHVDRPRIVFGQVTRTGAEVDKLLVGQGVVAYTTKPFETLVTSNTFVSTKGYGNAVDLVSTLPSLCKAVDAILKTGSAKAGDHVLLLSMAPSFIKTVSSLGQLFGFQVTSSKDPVDIHKLLTSQTPPSIVVAGSSSALSQDTWYAMPPGSNFVLVDASVDWTLDMKPFSRGVSFLPSGISILGGRNPESLKQILERAIELIVLGRGILQTGHLLSVEALWDIATLSVEKDALEYGIVNYAYGRSKVKVKESRKQINLSSTSAYLLVGCLGGLGRSLTPWMLERGCRNFQAGASVYVFKADASDEKAVETVVATIQATIPIRGVVHAAMVLQDGMFEGLTYDKYIASVNPKMKGALSLHKALLTVELDFFANYCAGNSYLDSLAWYRRKQGLAASSIALPMILDVGVVAENEDLKLSLNRKGMYGIDEDEMLQAFEAGMLQGPPLSAEDASLSEAHIILGLEPTALAKVINASGTTDALWNLDGGFLTTLADKDFEEAIQAVARHVIERCSKILMIPMEKFATTGRSIASYGVDSMVGVELRTWLYKDLGFDIGFQTLLGASMDFTSLAKMVVAGIAQRC